MVIQVDSREKARAITKILATFDREGVKHFVSKLPVADYMNYDNPRLVIDRKQNLGELCQNVSDIPQRDSAGRVKRYENGEPMTPFNRLCHELSRANEYGIKVIFLCEHGRSIAQLADVMAWKNPRLKESPMAISGERLYRKLLVLQNRYGAGFEFCTKAQTGKRIIDLLRTDHQ